MAETTYFEHEGVQVTNARFVVDGETYAMRNITSVKPLENKPSRVWPLLVMAVGVAPLAAGQPAGVVLIIAGAIWLFMQKPMYHVMLHTSGGETSALKTRQKDYLQKVVQALNDAIAHKD